MNFTGTISELPTQSQQNSTDFLQGMGGRKKIRVLMPDIQTLGNLISEFRAARNVSRAAFARKAQVDPSTIYNIERGKTQGLRTEQFAAVAAVMGKTAEELTAEIGETL